MRRFSVEARITGVFPRHTKSSTTILMVLNASAVFRFGLSG